MPTYVYETLPAAPAEAPRRFEMKQSMRDAPLTHDAQTGGPVRRVIQSGYLNTQRWTKAPAASAGGAAGGSCCGIAGCGPH